jgi:hypothetical protein
MSNGLAGNLQMTQLGVGRTSNFKGGWAANFDRTRTAPEETEQHVFETRLACRFQEQRVM